MRPAPQDDNFSVDSAQSFATGDVTEQSRATLRGLGGLIERVTPWLFSVGSWIFGGLTAFGLVAISALLTIGPVDKAVLISITAFACALPLNVSGIFLLRLVTDIQDIKVDDLALRAFQSAGFPGIEAHFLPSAERQSRYKKMSNVALAYSLGAGVLAVTLTVVGLVSALWHMAWWVGIALFAVIVFCTCLSIVVVGHSLSAASDAGKN